MLLLRDDVEQWLVARVKTTSKILAASKWVRFSSHIRDVAELEQSGRCHLFKPQCHLIVAIFSIVTATLINMGSGDEPESSPPLFPVLLPTLKLIHCWHYLDCVKCGFFEDKSGSFVGMPLITLSFVVISVYDTISSTRKWLVSVSPYWNNQYPL